MDSDKVVLPIKLQGANQRDDALVAQQESKPIDRCPRCKVGRLRRVETLAPQAPAVPGGGSRLVAAVLEPNPS